jgi:hypothetical protein
MNIIASAFATQKTQNQCLKKQNYTLFSNVGQLFEFSKKPFALVLFFKKFQNQRTICFNFFSISKSENCQFHFFEKNENQRTYNPSYLKNLKETVVFMAVF